MDVKSARRYLQILLPVSLLITSCAPSASAAGTSGDTSDSAAIAENTQSAGEQTQDPSAEIKSEDGAATDSAASANTATAESSTATPSTGYAPADDYPNPYEMETYDSVPEYLSERHDDVDYGTLDEDVATR